MITTFKLFEKYENKPQVGDYVICEEPGNYSDDIVSFFPNNIGRIEEIESHSKDLDIYKIRYTKSPETDEKTYSWWFKKSNIKMFSPNIDDVEIYMNKIKYNI